MRIADFRLLLPAHSSFFSNGAASGDIAQRGWVSRRKVANPMSIYPEYAQSRQSWMGPGQEHYAVEIETDTGEVGVCANYYGGAMACEIIRSHYKRFLIGQNPFDSAKIWDQMYRSSLPYGHGGLTGMAIAGVDLALWDLKGKILGQPVYRLLGGATKPGGIPCYLTTHPMQSGIGAIATSSASRSLRPMERRAAEPASSPWRTSSASCARRSAPARRSWSIATCRGGMNSRSL